MLMKNINKSKCGSNSVLIGLITSGLVIILIVTTNIHKMYLFSESSNIVDLGDDFFDPSKEIEQVGCRKLPDVLIVGFEKCGTMTLRQFLGIHPGIFTNKKRGNNKFFNPENDKPLVDFTKDLECTPEKKLRLEKLAVAGEAELVYKFIPNITIIVIVREPVERSLSYFLHLKASQKFRRNFTDFEQFLYSSLERPFEKETYVIQTSYYSDRIRPWIRLFGLDKILVLDGDKFAANPVPELNKAEKFLGLDPVLTADMFEYNEQRKFYCVKTTVDDGCMYPGKGRPHPVMRNETRAFLKEAFRTTNEKFFQLIRRRFPWND